MYINVTIFFYHIIFLNYQYKVEKYNNIFLPSDNLKILYYMVEKYYDNLKILYYKVEKYCYIFLPYNIFKLSV